MQKYNLIGQRFNHLTVIAKEKSRDNRNSFWLCQCDCGKTCVRHGQSIVSGRSFSCGCSNRRKGQNATHGMSKTRLYREWCLMRRRCHPDDTRDRKDYYDKGIRVCEEWHNDFVAFCDWSTSNGYSDALSLDRIDNSKGYSPDNCRWIPLWQQQTNKTTTVFIEYNGERRRLREVCAMLDFPYQLAHQRMRNAERKGIHLTQEELFKPSRMQVNPKRHYEYPIFQKCDGNSADESQVS